MAQGDRPELLDRLSISPLASPVMIPVSLVISFLYGMVLFAVLSSRKSEPEPEVAQEAPVHVAAAPSLPPSRDDEKPKATATKAEASPAVTRKSSEPVQIAKADTQKRRTDPPKKESTPKSAPSETPAPVDTNKPEYWDLLSGIPGDCKFTTDADGLSITIPPTLHVLSPDLNKKNAPKLLTGVTGDFTAIVKIRGKISPGTTPLQGLPFTFQGAGLLIWQDENNYLRLERASFFTIDRTKLHGALVEVCRDGKIVNNTFKDTRDTDLSLKIERRGSDVRCQYSTDEKSWFDVKRLPVSLPSAVSLGVTAANASPKPFTGRIEGFELTGSKAKP